MRNRSNNEEDGEEPRVHEQHHEIFSVVEAHAGVQPRTVVVHVEDALVASRAVVAPLVS